MSPLLTWKLLYRGDIPPDIEGAALTLFSLLQLAGRGLIKGRDHLMWVLLQFISGSIQKNALADFLPVMKLFDLLYPEKEVQGHVDVVFKMCYYRVCKKSIYHSFMLFYSVLTSSKRFLRLLKLCFS